MKITTKEITFSAMMGSLALVIASINFFGIVPFFGREAIVIDFTSLPVIIAAFFGGPIVGLISGIIAGIIPGFYFGFIGGILGILGPLSLSFGKALTGFTIGILRKYIIKSHANISTFFIVIVGFLPEAIWITILFLYIVPFVAIQGIIVKEAMNLYPIILFPVLLKASFEITAFAIITSSLNGNKGFQEFLFSKFNIR